MELRNEYWDYWLATQLTPLRSIKADDTALEVYIASWRADEALDSIINTGFTGLLLCRDQVVRLKTALDAWMPKRDQEWNREAKISTWQVTTITAALDALETALSIQFSQVNTYRVTSKGTHDVRKLIDTPEETFGKYWIGLSKVAQEDWRSGARALAFELPTACGFHVVRAMEAVVVGYLKLIEVTPEQRDLGHYVELMKKNKVSGEAIDIVSQIRKHHRNPLMHPQDTLDVPMAMSLYDLCRAAIVSLVVDMASRGLTLPGEGQGTLPLVEAAAVKGSIVGT